MARLTHDTHGVDISSSPRSTLAELTEKVQTMLGRIWTRWRALAVVGSLVGALWGCGGGADWWLEWKTTDEMRLKQGGTDTAALIVSSKNWKVKSIHRAEFDPSYEKPEWVTLVINKETNTVYVQWAAQWNAKIWETRIPIHVQANVEEDPSGTNVENAEATRKVAQASTTTPNTHIESGIVYLDVTVEATPVNTLDATGSNFDKLADMTIDDQGGFGTIKIDAGGVKDSTGLPVVYALGTAPDGTPCKLPKWLILNTATWLISGKHDAVGTEQHYIMLTASNWKHTISKGFWLTIGDNG